MLPDKVVLEVSDCVYVLRRSLALSVETEARTPALRRIIRDRWFDEDCMEVYPFNWGNIYDFNRICRALSVYENAKSGS